MNRQSIASDERDYGAFIPSFLDDYGLNADEFRVYAHIARRAGSGDCWEGIDAIANHCKMNVKTARKAIAMLIKAGLLSSETRKGKTNVIRLKKHSLWVDSTQLEAIRKQLTPTKTGTTKTGTPTKTGTTSRGRTTPTYLGTPPLPAEADEGTPIKVLPEVTPSLEEQPSEREPIASLPSEPVTPHQPASLSKNAEAPDSDRHPIEDGYSADNSPAELKPRSDRFIHPTEASDRRLKGTLYPWEISFNQPDRAFVEYVSKQMSTDGSQNPIGKARNCILNQQGTDVGIAKLSGHWEDYQELKRAAIANQQLTQPAPLQPAPYVAETPLTQEEIDRRKEIVAAAKRSVSHAS